MQRSTRALRIAILSAFVIPTAMILMAGSSNAQVRPKGPKFGPAPKMGGPKMHHPRMMGPQGKGVWICGNCQKQIGTGAAPPAMCPFCGVKLVNGVGGPNNSPPQPQPQQPQSAPPVTTPPPAMTPPPPPVTPPPSTPIVPPATDTSITPQVVNAPAQPNSTPRPAPANERTVEPASSGGRTAGIVIGLIISAIGLVLMGVSGVFMMKSM